MILPMSQSCQSLHIISFWRMFAAFPPDNLPFLLFFLFPPKTRLRSARISRASHWSMPLKRAESSLRPLAHPLPGKKMPLLRRQPAHILLTTVGRWLWIPSVPRNHIRTNRAVHFPSLVAIPTWRGTSLLIGEGQRERGSGLGWVTQQS